MYCSTDTFAILMMVKYMMIEYMGYGLRSTIPMVNHLWISRNLHCRNPVIKPMQNVIQILAAGVMVSSDSMSNPIRATPTVSGSKRAINENECISTDDLGESDAGI